MENEAEIIVKFENIYNSINEHSPTTKLNKQPVSSAYNNNNEPFYVNVFNHLFGCFRLVLN